MSSPFATRLCDSSGLPEPAESQSQDCGSKNPTATCMRGQCCNADGQCGPIPNRDGQFILNGAPMSRTSATDFFCKRNQGDWRNWSPAGSCSDIPVKYPRDTIPLAAGPAQPPVSGSSSADSGLSPTQWAILLVSVLVGMAIIGEVVKRTRVYLAGKKRAASEPPLSQRRASSVHSRPSYAGSEYVFETVHEAVPVRPRNSMSVSPFVNGAGRMSYSESPAGTTARSSIHRLSLAFDDGISIRSGTPADHAGGPTSSSPLYQYDPATIFLPAPPASTGPNPFPKYAQLLRDNPGLVMGSRIAAFPYLPSAPATSSHLNGASTNQLLVCAKQLVSIHTLTPDGWAVGTAVDTGARGAFPAWILRPNGEADVLIRALTEEYVHVMQRAAQVEYAAFVQAAQGHGNGNGNGDFGDLEYTLPEASEIGANRAKTVAQDQAGDVELEQEKEPEQGVVLVPFAKSSFDIDR